MTIAPVEPEGSEPPSMTVDELAIYAEEKQRTLAEVLADDKYELISTTHDPENGSYIILAERGTKVVNQGFMEMGYSSPSPWTAWTRNEKVPQLRDKQGIRTYYDMKRSDGTVRGALRILKTPILAAHWFVQPASESTIDVNIAKFVEKNLFENLNIPWTRVIEEALLMCEYGYYPMELVYEEKNGQIWLKKLAGRHPLDIREWEYDENGGPNFLIMEPTESSGWAQVYIPIEKLVVFVFEEEGGDLRGTSVLRSSYKHFYYKDNLYKIDCVDEETEIFTMYGWKKYNEVKIGDKTLSINTKTGLCEWDAIGAIHQDKGIHNMIKMENGVFSAMTTPNHRWWVRNKWSYLWKWKTTDTLSYFDEIPEAKLVERLPESKYEDSFVELNGMVISEEKYEGTIWCVSTKNGNWLARRNGSVYYTGNSIQKERHGIGVPIIKLPLGYTQEDRNIAENLGRNLRVNERAHIVAPANWEIEFAKLEGQPVDCMTSVAHHDMKILSNVLAPFLDDSDVKADSMDIFLKSTRYIAANIGDMINKFVIKKLVDVNFARGGYPKIHARRIGEWEDMRTMSFTLRNLVGAGLVTPDDELERQLREEIDMPAMDKETARVVKTPQAPKPSPSGPPRQSTSPPVGLPSKNSGTDKSGGS